MNRNVEINGKKFSIELNRKERTELSISDISINNMDEIKGLENLKPFEILQIFSVSSEDNLMNIIDSLSLVQKHELKEIYIPFCNLDTIINLTDLPNLESLHLDNNKISEIRGLDSLASLKKLSLCDNLISELRGLDILII